MICLGGRPCASMNRSTKSRSIAAPLMGNLVIPRRLPSARLQTVERRLAGRRRAVRASGFQLARQYRHDRIAAQVVVVIKIFVAERERKHPLAHQGRYRVLDKLLTAMIAKAPRKTDQPDQSPDRSLPTTGRRRPRSPVPASNAASTARPSTTPKSSRSALHSVGIGALLGSERSRCGTKTFAGAPMRLNNVRDAG